MSTSRDNMDFEMFNALKNPIRRIILRTLSNEPTSFSDLLKELKIESSHLSYHLECLRNLLSKTEDGKYALSNQGRIACSMMREIEGNCNPSNSEVAVAKKYQDKTQNKPHKRVFKLGKLSVPLWVLVVPLVLIVSSTALGYYLYSSVTVPLKINEPIQIVNYPSQWNLFPGDSVQFNVTVNNVSSQNYTVTLEFACNDMTYQAQYLTFDDAEYTVIPGQQNLASWLNVSSAAPAADLNVTITVARETYVYQGGCVVNGDFETGNFAGWTVEGICSITSTIVHSGNYAAFVSDQADESSITQTFSSTELPVDSGIILSAWIYPNNVGELFGEYPSASLVLKFNDSTTGQFAFDIYYTWCWNNYAPAGNITSTAWFTLPSWTAGQWNLLQRNVTADIYSYFNGTDFSSKYLSSIWIYYHYSDVSPGSFYIDDISLTSG